MKAAITAALVALALLPEPAYGQGLQCNARQVMIDGLKEKYGEDPVSMGVTSNGGLLEVLVSPTGSWSILVTVPGGPTCLVSSGEGWRSLTAKAKRGPAA